MYDSRYGFHPVCGQLSKRIKQHKGIFFKLGKSVTYTLWNNV